MTKQYVLSTVCKSTVNQTVMSEHAALESSMDDDYVYSVSIALSPIVFDEQPVDEREDEDTKQVRITFSCRFLYSSLMFALFLKQILCVLLKI